MTRRMLQGATLLMLLPLTGLAALQGPSLERRVASSTARALQFHFAARAGICGDGRHYVRLEGDDWIGSIDDLARRSPCEAGPVRVLVTRSGAEAIRVETFVGPLAPSPGADDLGRVAARDAAAYLAGLATRGEGRVARDAMAPLGMADSATVAPVLLALVRDGDRPRDTRRSALTWLVRRRATPDALPEPDLVALLAGIARSDDELLPMRQTAIGLLGRLEGDAGIPALVEMSRAGDGRTARLATEALARSGDPRARRALRELAGETRATADARAAALTGLGGEFGSAQDAELLMTLYPGLSNDRLRDAALAGVASIGTAAGRRWLLALVRDESAEGRVRRKAASLLERAGVPVRDVTAAYDGVSDGEVRVQLIELLARAGTRDALAKLVAIARADTQPAARRRAIVLLGRSEDAAVREALRDLVGQ